MKLKGNNGRYTFRAETWESNKGARRWMSAWALLLWIPELCAWYKLEGSHRDYPLHPFYAQQQVRMHFDRAMQGDYDERIATKILGKDEAQE